MLLALMFGCALSAHRTGLVERQDAGLLLRESTGRSARLVASGDAAPLNQLDGCIVEVRGPRLGRRLLVHDWSVLDAGDGSAPFIGRLTRYGGNWLLEDRNTGRPVLLDERSAAALAAEEGHLLLVNGVVIGAQTVRVLSWRSLEPAP